MPDIDTIARTLVVDVLTERLARPRIAPADAASDAATLHGIARLLIRMGEDAKTAMESQKALTAAATDPWYADVDATLREMYRAEVEYLEQRK